MVQLVSAETYDWTKYPPLKDGQAKLADLERRLADLEVEVEKTTTAEAEAKADHDEQEVRSIIGQVGKGVVANAREAYERATAAATDQRSAIEPHRQAVDRLRNMLPVLEEEAKREALDRAEPAYAAVVARLAESFKATSVINEELAQLRDSIPQVAGYNLGRFPLPWPQLRMEIPGDEGAQTPLVRWLREAEENGFL